ncbi:hypothetical protein C2845_PM09G03170 [Panicum miliaceum]|uniref:Uncharacterized protein n=1 Tax=Panicum miliaceum TaxID=4540 RepID=A0A3L6RYC7_PANMI|nr:hypothetical protein C2845_PM09G03170 [Panicum miliaceum]
MEQVEPCIGGEWLLVQVGSSPSSRTAWPNRRNPPPIPPATPRRRGGNSAPQPPPQLPVAILVGLAVNLALCVRRVGGEDRRALAFVGFSHLNLLLLFGALRRFEVSPHGSPARGLARLAVWLLTATLTAAFTWRIGALLPLGFAVAAWIMAAATVLGGFYMLFLHGEK